ncbi:MAG TPA: OsmC family protein [Pirellulaceae bacterium]|nr:OsmC family protein [Pirellulaceae bacterium]
MNFPHHYSVSARCTPTDPIVLAADGLNDLASAPPRQFGGPGDLWSPEDLLVAAVADCFVLSFRAIAAASKFEFVRLECRVTGTLDRVERAMLFTEFNIEAELAVAPGVDTGRAERLLEKAEQSCLITNSLKSTVHLNARVVAV